MTRRTPDERQESRGLSHDRCPQLGRKFDASRRGHERDAAVQEGFVPQSFRSRVNMLHSLAPGRAESPQQRSQQSHLPGQTVRRPTLLSSSPPPPPVPHAPLPSLGASQNYGVVVSGASSLAQPCDVGAHALVAPPRSGSRCGCPVRGMSPVCACPLIEAERAVGARKKAPSAGAGEPPSLR